MGDVNTQLCAHLDKAGMGVAVHDRPLWVDAAMLDERVQAIGRNLRRQVSTEAHVKHQRTLVHVRERSALLRMLGRRHALGEFG